MGWGRGGGYIMNAHYTQYMISHTFNTYKHSGFKLDKIVNLRTDLWVIAKKF